MVVAAVARDGGREPGDPRSFPQGLSAQSKSSGEAEMTILWPSNRPAALPAVTSGRAVGNLTDHSTASCIAQTTKDGETLEVVTDPTAPNGYHPQIVGIGMVDKSTGLINTVQKALQAPIDDGACQRIIGKYGLLPVQSAEVDDPTTP